jgi:phenylpropionate dioxygenase-like ring-hydroxylating dioxygenase large terminal subunit
MTECHEHLLGHWFAAAEAKSLSRRPLGVTVLGTPLVVYRANGLIVAAEDRCPHRNVPLSMGRLDDGRLRCAYHGWCFDAGGRCVEAPGVVAELPQVELRQWRAEERDGFIWVAFPDKRERLIYRADVDRSAYQRFIMSAEIEADFADALENLLDGTHTPFVHSGLVRGAGSQNTFTATVRRRAESVEAEYRGESGQNGIISRWFEPPRDVSFGRYHPPCTAELEYRSLRRTELLVAAHFTPTTEGRLRIFISCYLPGGRIAAAMRFAVVRPFFQHVFRQDAEILRRQRQNVSRFGGRSYTHWTGDLLRPWIDAWLCDGRFPDQTAGAHEVRFHL